MYVAVVKAGNLMRLFISLMQKAPGEDSPVSEAATEGTVDALPSKAPHSARSDRAGRAQDERWGLARKDSETLYGDGIIRAEQSPR